MLLETYRPIFNEYCEGYGKNEFSSLEEAEDECSKNELCIGLMDNCGEGKSFYLCSKVQSQRPSRCRSILYLAPSKLHYKYIAYEYN